MREDFAKIFREGGTRIAAPDDPIYRNASWRISFPRRQQRVEPNEKQAEHKAEQNGKEEK
jgi:hypothetical protein